MDFSREPAVEEGTPPGATETHTAKYGPDPENDTALGPVRNPAVRLHIISYVRRRVWHPRRVRNLGIVQSTMHTWAECKDRWGLNMKHVPKMKICVHTG